MASTTSNTQYAFNLEIDHNGTMAEGTFTLPAGIGVDDAFIFELLAAINGVSWPTGITKPFSVYKSSTESTSYTTDTSTTPPAFT